MSADGEVDFDSLPESEVDHDGSDSNQFINLEPGDSLVGELAYQEFDVGGNDSTILCIRTGPGEYCKYWSNGQVNSVLGAEGVSLGDTVGIRKTEETDSFENDDGEEIEYHLMDVRVAPAEVDDE